MDDMRKEIAELKKEMSALKKDSFLDIESQSLVLGRRYVETLEANTTIRKELNLSYYFSLHGCQTLNSKEFNGVQFRLVIDDTPQIPEDILVIKINDEYLGDKNGKLVALNERKVGSSYFYDIENLDDKPHKIDITVLHWGKDYALEKQIERFKNYLASTSENVRTNTNDISTTKATIEEAISKLNKSIADNKSGTDEAIKGLNKTVADNKGGVDDAIGGLNKIVVDNKSGADEALKGLNKIIADNKSGTDEAIKGLNKTIADNKVGADETIGRLSKTVADNKSGVDDVLGGLNKAIAENKSGVDGAIQGLNETIKTLRIPFNFERKRDQVVSIKDKFLINCEFIADSGAQGNLIFRLGTVDGKNIEEAVINIKTQNIGN